MSGEDLFEELRLILFAFYTQEKHKADIVQHSNGLCYLIVPVYFLRLQVIRSARGLWFADTGMRSFPKSYLLAVR